MSRRRPSISVWLIQSCIESIGFIGHCQCCGCCCVLGVVITSTVNTVEVNWRLVAVSSHHFYDRNTDSSGSYRMFEREARRARSFGAGAGDEVVEVLLVVEQVLLLPSVFHVIMRERRHEKTDQNESEKHVRRQEFDTKRKLRRADVIRSCCFRQWLSYC